MNGAIALDCENTSSSPNSTKTTTIGRSQYFFSCFRNSQKSPSTRPLLMIVPSKHPIEMLRVLVTRRVRRPAVPSAAAPRQRILTGQPPEQPDRRQHQEEHDRQQ